MKSRDQRRHDRERIKAHARYIFVTVYQEPDCRDFAVRNAEHLKTCSCAMCGNPRKHCKGSSKDALTYKERRALAAWKQDEATP